MQKAVICFLSIYMMACEPMQKESVTKPSEKGSFELGSEKTETEGVKLNSINDLLDNWHKAAAEANADQFFGSMTEDCIYLGTDATEKWKRDELRSWAASAFERETAWDFTPYEREVYSESNDLAWFDEKLDTWMGECRGSGVVKRTPDGWKLKQYNLAVTISNDKIKDFMAIEQEKSFSQISH